MENPIADIYDYEVSNLINKLLRFLGRKEVENCLHKYQASLQYSGPIFRKFYLKNRHPWWQPLTKYFELEKTGKSIRRNVTEEIKVLVGDAKKVTTLQKLMPDSVKMKYKRDLIDDNRAYDYLFEIQVAWHFFRKGYGIQWHENNSIPHSEFLVKSPEFEFNVECKRISIDASRKIRRRDFYRLADKIIPKIQRQGYSGYIDIALKERLHGDDKFLDKLSSQVISKINVDRLKGSYQIPLGSLSIDLKSDSGIVIDFDDCVKKFSAKNQFQTHGLILAKSKDGKPIDPIGITLKSERADNILSGIRDKISEAAKTQLDKSKPGLIVCFLEGINDVGLDKLATNSGLQKMTSLLFLKDELSHIAAIGYSSESIVKKTTNTEEFSNEGLTFSNPHCKFEKAKSFQFLSKAT